MYLNAALKEICGDVIGKKCYETVLASEDICKDCPITHASSELDFPYTRTARSADGSLIELTVSRIEDPETGEAYYLSFEQDMSVQSEKDRNFRSLASCLDQMPEAVAISDANGNGIYVNDAFTAMSGMTKEDAVRYNLLQPHPDTPQMLDMNRVMSESLENGWTGHTTMRSPDGSMMTLHVETKPVRDPAGEVIGIVGMFRDVTREASEKEELEKYKSQLEKKMESRTAELARRVSQLTTINKISRVVTSILDPDELIDEFVKSIATGFGYQHVVIMSMDKERGELHFRSGYGAKVPQVSRDIKLKLKEGIIGHAAFFSETLVTGDVDSDPRYVSKEVNTTKSELAIPIVFRGDLIGVLDIQSDQEDAFTRNDVTLLEMLTDILATAIVNARTFSESKEREKALTVLDRISKQISFRQEPGVILDQVARDAASLLKGEKALVGLKDEETDALIWLASYNVERDMLEKLEFSAARGVTGRALARLKAEVVNDYAADPDSRPRDMEMFNIRSLATAPLIIEGKGIGVVNVYNKLDGQKFTKSDAMFLSSLADHAAIALENSNLLSSLNQRVKSQLALLETTLSMQMQIDSSGIYEYVAEKLREVIWYDSITFYKVDHERGLLIPMLARGSYTDETMTELFPLSEGISGHVAKTGKAELVNDAMRDERTSQVVGTPDEDEAIMAIPLKGKERTIGVLTVYRIGGKTFSPADFEITQLFASQAAVAVENSQLYKDQELLLRDSRKKVVQMARLLELTKYLMFMDDLGVLLDRLTNAVVSSFGFRRASVSILDPGKNVFTNLALAGYPEWVKVGENMAAEDVLEDMKDEFRVGENSYYVKFEDQAYGIDAFGFLAHPELADKPRSTSDAWHERDILMVSLKDRRGRLIGYMLVDEPVDLKVPTKEQIDVLEILGGIASIAVENSKAYERQVVAVNEIALLNDLMTHDINNFNQGIMGYIELLLQDSRLDEGQRKYAEKALMQVRNNARVIDNIRKLSKVRALSEKELTIWDLHDSVNSAIETISKSHTERTVYVTPAVPKGVHYVRANHFMNEVFLNILSNAVKFDNSKIVKIDLKIEEVSDTQGEFWQISIADHGRGIPDDRKRAIFERLTTGMTGVKGFGLGLSIVSTIVEKLQGRVWVEDRVAGDYSKGTVFKIMLPKVMREENSRGSSVK